ncbi:nucleoside hydrolase [Cohnella xylanilytica]|uniref:nucleoside hydrolase n=1 Tax=Cohnella TaxID=329857 RepID=UPI0009BA5A75|nr:MULTISPECIES: nucleoside hydrolase [Cohnella]MBN2980195.1 nucleoside hydrolase [Cohnella algarum]GIO15895.1 nucleoside hydrolase [Cohnella xylanilytica]
MKRLLIDTDTAGDDVTSLLFALRWPGAKLESITTVHGNIPVDMCTRNALTTVEMWAGERQVPVYEGCARPLLRPRIAASFVHGSDGMGESHFPPPGIKPQSGHAAQAIVEIVNRYPGELEIIAHGPLTNLAVAYMLDPSIAGKVKHLWIMGGARHFQGNITPSAEFNFYADPEAAQMVLQAGFAATTVGWDITCIHSVAGGEHLRELQAIDTPLARFYQQINRSALRFNRELGGIDGITHPDSITTAICLVNEVMTKSARYYAEVECQSGQNRGYYAIDTRPHPEPNPFWKGGEPNVEVCLEADFDLFFRMLKAMLSGDYRGFEAV